MSINSLIDLLELWKIIFKHRNGPRYIPYELPVCVIFEFKESNVSETTKWRTDLHKHLIQIAPITILCERKVCTVTSIPLRICKVITIHKALGMSIGSRKPFESMII